MNRNEKIREQIRENYGRAAREGGCCQAGCGCGGKDLQQTAVQLGYSPEELDAAPESANMGLGCGNPTAIASLQPGETVLDLGCGGGFDCFLAQKKVGVQGHVIGVDMTPDMIRLARQNAVESGCPNVDFRLGEIEHLPVSDNSVDVIISNCVLNLSPDKEQVLREAFRVLKPGGRLAVSDVVALKELPPSAQEDVALINGCLGGAEHIEQLENMLKDAGFSNIRLTPAKNSREIIGSWHGGEELTESVASCSIEAVKGGQNPRGACCAGSSVKSDCC